jgi:hypothetical protein
MTFKEKVYQAFKQLLEEKINDVQLVLKDLHYSAANETKSTAGDKHETALAMLQIEQENKRKQLSELQLQQSLLKKIDPLIISPVALNGSVVYTDNGYFFISVALGKLILDGHTIFSLSPSSPLGRKLTGQRANGKVELNGRTYSILDIE